MSPFFQEWKRADGIKGRLRSDPYVQATKRRRVEEFGPDFAPLPGEEFWEETLAFLYGGLEMIQALDASRVLVLTHRHRALMYLAYILAGGVQKDLGELIYDFERFPTEFVSFFKAFDAHAKFDNVNFLEFEYRERFGSDEVCWNWNAGQKIL
jgi:hypothetical protein